MPVRLEPDTLLIVLALVVSVVVLWWRSRRLAQALRRLEAVTNHLLDRLQQQVEADHDRLDTYQPAGWEALQARVEALTAQQDSLHKLLDNQQHEVANTVLALSLLPLGERQYRSKDLPGALDTYQRALELSPDNPAIHYRLGYIHAQKGELDTAEKHLKRALTIDAAFYPALAALGYVNRRRGEVVVSGPVRERYFAQAEQALLKALYNAPRLLNEDGDSWWVTLGGLYRDRRQFSRAVDAYRKAARVTPYSSYPFSHLALFEGLNDNVDGMLQTYREVERIARQEIQAAPDDYWPYADLLAARLALGKIQEAEETLNIILRIIPHDLVYAAPRLINTLETLSNLMPEGSEHVREVLGHFRQQIARRTAEDIKLANQSFVIPFSDGLPALGVRVSLQDPLEPVAEALELQDYRSTILILGGAMETTSPEMQATRGLIEQGLIPYVQNNKLAVIDGGTDAGVMRLMGQSRRKRQATFPLIGVAPVNLVKYPGYENPDGYDLESGHSHFILTPDGEWGDETDTMVQFTSVLTNKGKMPGVVLVINGGAIVRQEVYRLAVTERLRFPVLVLEGSGRFADTLAQAYKTGVSDDDEVREIIRRGQIEIVPVSSGAEGLRRKFNQFLQPGG